MKESISFIVFNIQCYKDVRNFLLSNGFEIYYESELFVNFENFSHFIELTFFNHANIFRLRYYETLRTYNFPNNFPNAYRKLLTEIFQEYIIES